ncbi:MAG: adenosylhomocysteinase, partial [Synergistaceae bacterium]|nr:adenosylhomocysteinase [Synergistaceae bacterium]
GRLVNIAAGDGHPIEIMDMSFAIQLLCILHIAGGASLRRGLESVPELIDNAVANYKLESLGFRIEKLTLEQEQYMRNWRE